MASDRGGQNGKYVAYVTELRCLPCLSASLKSAADGQQATRGLKGWERANAGKSENRTGGTIIGLCRGKAKPG